MIHHALTIHFQTLSVWNTCSDSIERCASVVSNVAQPHWGDLQRVTETQYSTDAQFRPGYICCRITCGTKSRESIYAAVRNKFNINLIAMTIKTNRVES